MYFMKQSNVGRTFCRGPRLAKLVMHLNHLDLLIRIGLGNPFDPVVFL